VRAIVADLEQAFNPPSGLEPDVLAFLDIALQAALGGVTRMNAAAPGPPLWLLAELTYRCPLHCAFCYNPVDFAKQDEELGTEDWLRVLREAPRAGRGAVRLLRRRAAAARRPRGARRRSAPPGLLHQPADLGRRPDRGARGALKAAGLDHVQLSFQDSTREMNDFLSHTKTFELKQRVAR
jgi:pyrroloquinoline quinone biosynthesis protein E